MYGTNAPLGFIPQSSLVGATWNNQTRAYPIVSGYGTAIYKGDPVMRASTGGIVIWGGAGQPCLGIFQGCFYYDQNGNYVSSPYWPASTATLNTIDAQALITDDRNVVYTAQVSTNSTANPAVAFGLARDNLGCNIEAAVGIATNGFGAIVGPGGTYTPPNNPVSGSATNGGLSAYYLNLSTMSNTATVTFKIIGFDTSVNPGQVAYVAGPPTVGVFNNALVTINNHIYGSGTGTVGTGTVKTTGP